MCEVGHHGQNAGVSESERVELLAVVLGVAERELRPPDVGRQLAASPEAQLDEIVMHADEVVGRRDVVIDERHPPRERVRRPRGPRSNREMVDEHVVGRDRADHLAVICRQVLQSAIRRLDEDLRFVARRQQGALNAEDFMADRVTVAQCREHLVDATAAHADLA